MASNSSPTYQVVLEAGYLAIVDTLCLVGNSLMFVSVYRNRSLMRTVPNVFVLALSALDLTMGVFGIPMNLIAILHGGWRFGDFLCSANGCFIYFWASASIGTLSLTALNRFYRVVKPDAYRSRFTARKAMIMIMLVWTTTLLTFLLITLIVPMRFEYGQAHFCTGKFDSKAKSTAVGLTLHVVLVAGPMCVIILCYYQVFRLIHRHNMAVAPSLQSTNRRRDFSAEEIKITRLLFVIVLCFFVCWTPAVVVGALHYGTEIHLPESAHLVYGYACVLSTIINPFLYGAKQKCFRNEFKKIFADVSRCECC